MRPLRRADLRVGRLLRLLLVVLPLACGGEDPIGPDEELDFLVGDWVATRFRVEHQLNPDLGGDLIADFGAAFTLNVQPSGQYTAILTFQGTPLVEIGEIELDGSSIVFDVSEPCCSRNRGTWEYDGSTFSFRGPTQNDFNGDGQPEPANVEVSLVPR